MKQRIFVLANIILRCLNTIYNLPILLKKHVLISGFWRLRFGRLTKRNFGDELNYYIFHQLLSDVDLKICNYSEILHIRIPNLLFIGSIIEDYCNSSSVIWGSGCTYAHFTALKEKPFKVCAVRGKLTRQRLVEQGIECPEVYGDPALLLPLLYTPVKTEKCRVGIIPHVSQLNHFKQIEINSNVKVINFNNYKDWRNVIDEICSCDLILSSSLHGLIIADAYKVPNVWFTRGYVKGGGVQISGLF